MNIDSQLEVDLNLSAEVARAANLLVTKGHSADLRSTAAHFCGALGLVIFSMSKPGHALDSIPGLVQTMRDVLSHIEQIEKMKS